MQRSPWPGHEVLIDVEEALTLHAGEDAPLFVDCRFVLVDPEAGEAAWREATVPGAAYAHLDHSLSGPAHEGNRGRHPLPSPERAMAQLAALGIHAQRRVVAFDGIGGPFAARLWWMCRWLGMDVVRVLDGGWQAWLEREGSTAPGEAVEAAPAGSFSLRPELAVDARSLEAMVRSAGDCRLIDARAPERFSGAEENIDSEGGHIPGAENLPWVENLDVHGRFLPREALAARFRALLSAHAPQDVVVYCGSGVTACHDLLAMHHAGFEGARLYPGSWSDWIRDPDRPRATGS